MQSSSQMLDITKINPDHKCQSIFLRFDALSEGESFILESDQDPVYLYHHLMAERPEPFSWMRLEDGPIRWLVKIGKPILQEKDFPIGKLAALDNKKAEIFQLLGIHYCCDGEKTLKEACEEAGIRPEILEQYYEEVSRHKEKEVYHFEQWDPGFLAEYIMNTHHGYLKQNIPLLVDLSITVGQQYGIKDQGVKELVERLNFFLADLEDHMRKEEQHLFPLIAKLSSIKKKKGKITSQADSGLRAIIRKLEKEHQEAGKDLRHFKILTNSYLLPKETCESCTLLYAKLIEFENDMIQHIHLENNLLFPKALALEKEVMRNGPASFEKGIY